ncbi:Early growth response protein 1-A [Schistosoma japonicum]|nr:Early growth response protein 1-A [Schistosoma japonicum]KAH8878165.1 Early growth response protein 1-A [Schistosoma japonicum]KAH8878166.1 Early growth response protein 1-A [Schistosoma japonicum]
MKMLRTLNSNLVDWMLPPDDIKGVFNDIPTGHTPTYTTDDSYKDFSKWENLNTPTPLDKESDNYFIYPPNSTIKVEPTVEDTQSIHHNNRINTQLMEAQYLKPLTSCENDQTIISQPTFHSPLLYWSSEPHATASSTHEIKSEASNESVSLTSHINSIDTYNSNVMVNNWSTDCLLHSTKYNTNTVSPNYSSLYTNNNSSNTYTPPEIHTPWTTYQSSDIPIIPTTNNVSIIDQTDYTTSPGSIRTCSTCPITSMSTVTDYKFNINQDKSREYCFEIGYEKSTLQTEFSSANHNKSQKLSDQQKPFVCGMLSCNKRFVRIDELKRHQRTHSGIKQFICDICKKGFTRSDHLMTHRRTHTGERPYECKICDRRFARSDERNRHTKTHLRDKPRRGRKPRNATIPFSTTTCSTSSSTLATTIVRETAVMVTNSFPVYNVHPCYSMHLDNESFIHKRN